ncbi:MAG TPA: hypothetical protein VFB06_03650 [Streptosporangiaceae bacterium]|nr:hypothetical protein [Streptosporangiaceae bacterium]
MATDLQPQGVPASPAPAAELPGWTGGRVAALVAGTLLALVCFGLLAGSAFLTWADLTVMRNGYLTVGSGSYATSGYALASDPVELRDGWGWLGRIVGDVRIEVTSANPAKQIFVAIGPADDVSRYLDGVSYAAVSAVGDPTAAEHTGSVVPAPPGRAVKWAAHVTGTGTQALRWTTRSGTWMAIVMNPDGSKGVTARFQLAVSSPVLPALAAELLAAAFFVGWPAALLIIVPVRRVARGG